MNESAEIEITEPKYGACRFCHQICIDADDPQMTQSERDEVATLSCKCPQAAKYQRVPRDIENANRKISLLFGDFSVGAADTAKISITSKGTIKVERLKSVRCQME